jgi:hypothetical protein
MPQKIIDIDPSKPIASTVAELQLPPRPVILLLSDFDNQLDGQIRSICGRVIVPAALDPGALIVDNARCSGCAALIAQAALDQDKMAPLLGIVPNNRLSSDIDADHALVLRLPSAWTDLAKYTCQIVSELIENGNDPKPAIAVLFGGAELEKRTVIRCAARCWPVLVIKGTGGLADQILTARSAQSNGANTSTVTDPDLREILETATIYPSSIDAAVDDLNRILLGRLDRRPGSVDATLEQAWHRFDLLDLTAMEKQARFRLLEMALITLAVLAALFAILTTTSSRVPPSFRVWAHAHYIPAGSLHWLVLLTPITISVIGAYNSHFRDGNKWILLRGAAEALKREIFRFRAQAGIYSDEQCLETSRELKLAAKLKDITSALEQSEVNKTNLLSPPEIDVAKRLPQLQPKVDRNAFLNPDDYITLRLRDQVKHFIKKTGELARKLRLLQSAIYLVGAAGTLLAAIGLDVWVALATAGVTALTTKLQTDQIENSLVQYNQALAGLRNIDVWWTALSPWEKRRRNNIDVLVDQTEKTLESELAGWVQQMQSGLDKLTEKEPQKG